MLEDLLGMNIPMPYANWKDSYEFVLATQSDPYILFTRDVFHMQLGLEIVDDDEKAIKTAVKYADLDAIKFLLNESKLSKDELWSSVKPLKKTILLFREEVALLLIEDGRCFTKESNIEGDIYNSACEGLSKLYFYLINKYPQHIPEDIAATFLPACASGAEDIVEHILMIARDDLEQREIKSGYRFLNEVIGYDAPNQSYSLARHGRFLQYFHGFFLCMKPKIQSERTAEYLGEGIKCGKITDIESIRKCLFDNTVIYGLLQACIATLTVEYVEGVNALATELFKLLDNEAQIKASIRAAVSKGKIELAKSFQSFTTTM